jgi:transcriptional regulator with XRE-family HTH domain
MSIPSFVFVARAEYSQARRGSAVFSKTYDCERYVYARTPREATRYVVPNRPVVMKDDRLARLGAFLRERRRSLKPAEFGIVQTGRRHVQGLRREEVAERAGIGLSWYTSLEQGRARGVTQRTLNRIATALQLTSLERSHLLALARIPDTDSAASVPQALLDYVTKVPQGIAFLTTPAGDIVAWNDEAEIAFAFGSLEPQARNFVVGLVRGAFRESLPDWQNVLGNMIAVMHANYATYGDASFDALVQMLQAESPLFNAAWSSRRVEAIPLHVCLVRHPRRGTIPMQLFAFAPVHSPHHTLVVLIPSFTLAAEEK